MSVITVDSRVNTARDGTHAIVIQVGGMISQAHADKALALLHGLIRAQAPEIDKLKDPK